MVYEFEITFITGQAISRAAARDVLEHLIGFGPDDVYGTVTNLDRWAGRSGLHTERKKWGQRGFALGDDGFHQLHRTLVRRPAHITGADVMVIGKDAGQFAVGSDPFGPVFLATVAHLAELGDARRIRTRQGWRRFTEVIVHHAAVAHWIQRRDHGAAVGAFPDADIEGNANRSVLCRAATADVGCGLP